MGPDHFTDPEEAHDSWWEAYKKLGWTYGPERDDAKKTHPDMVPFNELGWEERINDQVWILLNQLARETITFTDPYDEGATQ